VPFDRFPLVRSPTLNHMISSLQASSEVIPGKLPAGRRTVLRALGNSWLTWLPSCAALLVLAGAFLVENHRFDRGLSVTIALSAALAAAPLAPWPAIAFAGLTVLGQSLGVVPGPLLAGVWGYGAVPLLLFAATLALLRQHQGTTADGRVRRMPRLVRALLTPPTSTALAGTALCALIATACRRDDIWMAYYFPPVVGDGRLRPAVYWVFLFLMAGAVCLAAWGAAVLVHRARRSADAQLKAEATVQAQAVELALQSERERISRELHDILAHSLTVVTAQAEGIRYIALQEPETARESAGIIASVSRTALRDVRHLLESESDQDAPAPGLQDLPELLDRFRSSEMPVRLEQDMVSLSPAQELAVYRVVQESLTNAFRHGQRAQGAHVRISKLPDAGVELEIVSVMDPHHHTAKPERRPGLGIPGMRQRAEALGGSLSARAVANHFTVTAVLP